VKANRSNHAKRMPAARFYREGEKENLSRLFSDSTRPEQMLDSRKKQENRATTTVNPGLIMPKLFMCHIAPLRGSQKTLME
jgi:hypothetical protein